MAGQPENTNFLSPIGFKLLIKKLPHVTYFCTQASIPDITLTTIENITNPFNKLPIPGEKVAFAPFFVQFNIDEDLKNYQEIFDWIVAIGFPDSFDQRKTLQQQLADQNRPLGGTGVHSDATLIITTNSLVPNIAVEFVDLYPFALSSIPFDIENSEVSTVKGDITFAYRSYSLSYVT